MDRKTFLRTTVAGAAALVAAPGALVSCASPKEKKQSSARYKAENGILAATAGRAVPEWLDVDVEHMAATVKEAPTREMIDVPVNEMLIVELYSK